MGDIKMYFVFRRTIRGVTKAYVGTVADGQDPAEACKTICGIGNPFYAFNTLPGAPTGVLGDWVGAPLVSAVTADNQTAIDAMLLDPPLDKLVF